jgi:hypothetical protein
VVRRSQAAARGDGGWFASTSKIASGSAGVSLPSRNARSTQPQTPSRNGIQSPASMYFVDSERRRSELARTWFSSSVQGGRSANAIGGRNSACRARERIAYGTDSRKLYQ